MNHALFQLRAIRDAREMPSQSPCSPADLPASPANLHLDPTMSVPFRSVRSGGKEGSRLPESGALYAGIWRGNLNLNARSFSQRGARRARAGPLRCLRGSRCATSPSARVRVEERERVFIFTDSHAHAHGAGRSVTVRRRPPSAMAVFTTERRTRDARHRHPRRRRRRRQREHGVRRPVREHAAMRPEAAQKRRRRAPRATDEGEESSPTSSPSSCRILAQPSPRERVVAQHEQQRGGAEDGVQNRVLCPAAAAGKSIITLGNRQDSER